MHDYDYNNENEFKFEEDFEDENFFLDVPTECPECGSPLELDTDYDKTRLLCSNCDYEIDVTEEFERAAKEYEMNEEDEDEVLED